MEIFQKRLNNQGTDFKKNLKPVCPLLSRLSLQAAKTTKNNHYQRNIHQYWTQIMRGAAVTDGKIVFSKYFLKMPKNPSHLNITSKKIILKGENVNTSRTLYYVPIEITRESIEQFEDWNLGEWFPIITINKKTIHLLGLYKPADNAPVPDVSIRLTRNNPDIPKLLLQLRGTNPNPTTSETPILPQIPTARTLQHTNQTKENNFGYNRRSDGADIIHPTQRVHRTNTPFQHKIKIDQSLIHIKPNLNTIWSRMNGAHDDYSSNIYLRRKINVQNEYYIITNEQGQDKEIIISCNNTYYYFKRLYPLSTKFRFMCKIFYNIPEHDWAQLTTGTYNISLLIPMVHEPYHSRVRSILLNEIN